MVIFHFISESSLIVRELNSINAKLHKYTGLFPSRLDDRIIELVGIPFRYLEWDGDKKSEMGRVNSFKNSFRCYHSFGNYERNDNNECWNAR